MSLWELVEKDLDTITKKLKVEGGYLYHVIVDGTAYGIKHFTTSMCFVPDCEKEFTP